MNRAELQTKIQLFRRELADLERIKVGCMTCTHYAMPECDKYNAKPPPDVVASGCDDWRHDGIPF